MDINMTETQKTIEERLLDLHIELIDPLGSSKTKIWVKCKKCNNSFKSSPTTIFQSNVKYNSNGCKVCAIKNNRTKRLEKNNIPELLKQHGIEIVGEYTNTLNRHLMKCTKCNNKPFEAIPSAKVEQIKKDIEPCPFCNKEERAHKKCENINKRLSKISLKVHDPKTYTCIYKSCLLTCVLCDDVPFTAIPGVLLRDRKDGVVGCKSCARKAIFNIKSCNDSEIGNRLKDIGLTLLEPYKGFREKHNMLCDLCKTTYTNQYTPQSKLQNFKKHNLKGCCACIKQQQHQVSRNVNLQKIAARGITVLDPNYKGERRSFEPENKILVRNEHCKHEFYVHPTNLIEAEVECAICGPQKRIAKATEWSKTNSAKYRETAPDWLVYKSKVVSLTSVTYRDNKDIINPNNYPRGKAGDEGAYQLDHIVPIRFCFDNNIPFELCADVTNLQMLPWEQNLQSKDALKGSFPPLFYDYIDHTYKNSRYIDILNSHLVGFDSNVTINGCTVPLYSEEHRLAIVIIYLNKIFAKQKIALKTYQSIVSVGKKCLVFFEDDINDRLDIVLSMIKHKTTQNINKVVYARHCSIKRLMNREYIPFLKQTHILGSTGSTVAYGAYYNDVLVAVMLFSPPKMVKANSRPGVWELTRFSTSTEYRIPGIASKLLETFKREQNWLEIYSYVDKRVSDGNLYKSIGMYRIKDSEPSYHYIFDGIRRHSWRFTSEKLKALIENYDDTRTEAENLEQAGYWRVWDCGYIKFSVLNNKEEQK